MLSAADFDQDGFDDYGGRSLSWTCGSWTANATGVCAQAPVSLPNSTEIERVRIFVQDSAGSPFGGRFWTSNYFNGTTTGTPAKSSVADPAIQAVELPDAAGTVIDTSTSHYWISACLGTGDSLHAARVDYTIPDAATTTTFDEGVFGVPPESDGDSNVDG